MQCSKKHPFRYHFLEKRNQLDELTRLENTLFVHVHQIIRSVNGQNIV